MTVYPLIYSRILNDDYPHGFLTRPKDLDIPVASKYVTFAIENIQHVGGVRHAVFSAGDYLVYGGVACVAGKLVEYIRRSREIDFSYKEYQADKSGRPLIFFIGFAVRKCELLRNELPNIDLYSTYKIYLKYLANQWYKEKATSALSEKLELEVRPYNMKSAPQDLIAGGKHILRNYSEDKFQETVDHYFACMAWGRDGDFSFLSNVLPDDAVRSPFTNISPYNCTPEECARIMGDSAASTLYVPPVMHSESEFRTYNILDRTIAGMPGGSSVTGSDPLETEKKKIRSPNRRGNSLAAFGILVAAIIALLLFLSAQTKKAEASQQDQTAQLVSGIVITSPPQDILEGTIGAEPEDYVKEVVPDSLTEIAKESSGVLCNTPTANT